MTDMVQEPPPLLRSLRDFIWNLNDVAKDNTVTGYQSKNIPFVKQAPAWSEKSFQSGSQTTDCRDQGENMSRSFSLHGGSTSVSFLDRRERMADSMLEQDSSILDSSASIPISWKSSEDASVVLNKILGYKSIPTHMVVDRSKLSVVESPSSTDKSSPRRDHVDNSSFQLVEERKWNELIESIGENHIRAYVTKSGGSSTMSNGSRGNLLLHEVCKNEPPIDVVDALLKANEEAAEAKGQWGYLPLHCACSSGAAPAVVESLLRAFPEGAKTRDGNDLMLPIHLACKWGADEGILASLLNSHPEGILLRDIYGKLPIDYANSLRSQLDRDTAIACLRHASTLIQSARAQRTRMALEPEDVELRLQQLAGETAKREELEKAIDDQAGEYWHLLESEQKKVQVLEKFKALLEAECQVMTNLQESQAETIAELEQNGRLSTALQQQLADKANILEEKVAALEKTEKLKQKTIDEKLEHEHTDRLEIREVFRSLCDQQLEKEKSLEVKIQALERSEEKKQSIVENLQRALQDRLELLEASHTLRNEDLEAAFNKELANALSDQEFAYQTMVEATQQKVESLEAKLREVTFRSEDGTKYKNLFECEQNKVKLLEEERADEHQEIVDSNQLQKFENTVREESADLCSTKEQENEIEWKKSQTQYELRLEVERNRVEHLEASYFDAKTLLASEQKKVQDLERCTYQICEILEAERERAKSLEASHLASTKELKIEQDNVRKLKESETKAKALIESMKDALDNPRLNPKECFQLADAHQLLKGGQREIRSLELALAETQGHYEAEKKKTKAIQQSKWKRNTVLHSLQNRIFIVEQVHSQTLKVLENEREILQSTKESLVETEDLLGSERRKVKELTLSQAEWSKLLEKEKRAVGSLEGSLESHVTTIMTLELFQRDTQGLLEKEQDKVKALKQEQAEMQADRLKEIQGASLKSGLLLEASRFTVRQLEKKCVQKEELVLSDQRKVQQLENILEEKDTLINLEKKKAKDSEFDYSKMNSLLNAEARKVRELEKAASRLKADLKSEQRTVIALEQIQARKQMLIESEQNKVKALEHAQGQKQALLECKQKKVRNLGESRAKVQTKLKDAPKCLNALREQDAERQSRSTKLDTNPNVRAVVARLSRQAKKRDSMLSSVLQTLDSDDPQKLQNEGPTVGAKAHLSALTRKIATDAFGSLTEEENTARGTLARPAFGGLSLSHFLVLNRLGMFWVQSLYQRRKANYD
jgi:ankyrin repeat protein